MYGAGMIFHIVFCFTIKFWMHHSLWRTIYRKKEAMGEIKFNKCQFFTKRIHENVQFGWGIKNKGFFYVQIGQLHAKRVKLGRHQRGTHQEGFEVKRSTLSRNLTKRVSRMNKVRL